MNRAGVPEAAVDEDRDLCSDERKMRAQTDSDRHLVSDFALPRVRSEAAWSAWIRL